MPSDLIPSGDIYAATSKNRNSITSKEDTKRKQGRPSIDADLANKQIEVAYLYKIDNYSNAFFVLVCKLGQLGHNLRY